ncbi:hypothetical protein [Thalassobius sp. Cn5-15]|uniref:hypothetical protein n=1 Tax=Thalassobius sp. Cn5-15 TaxID=2917763 RepID=UPI001EF190A1|nr:hypothetical protein [Thalassobius sp. Cn5-15]MCG7492458.1 hypothetical protein [Thalassobius sp. Cn5-15]
MTKTIYAAICGIFSAAILAASFSFAPTSVNAWPWVVQDEALTVERTSVKAVGEAIFVPVWVLRDAGAVVSVVTDREGPFEKLHGKYAVVSDPTIGDMFDGEAAGEYFGAKVLLANEGGGDPRFSVVAADGTAVRNVSRASADRFIERSGAVIVSDERVKDERGESQF